MNEPRPKSNVSGTAILAGIVTFVLCTLLLHFLVGLAAGSWRSDPHQPLMGVLAIQGLEFIAIFLSALVNGAIFLTPIFLVTAVLQLWRVPHAICAGASAGAVLLIIGLIRFPESAAQILWPGALLYFAACIAASLTFRYASLR